MTKYSWKLDGPKPKCSAQVFGSTLERLAHGQPFEAVSPRLIVEEARAKNSPIHKAFPPNLWNDVKAAEIARLQYARNLLGRLQIVRVDVKDRPGQSERAFYRVETPNRRSGYVSRDHILSSRDYQRQVIEAARDALGSYLSKFGITLKLSRALPHLHDALDAMRDEIDQLTTDAMKRTDTARPVGEPEHAGV